MPEILAGAEPYAAGSSENGVLVLHGFTGTPSSVRGLAEAFAGAGFSVRLPLLPGHGTSIDDLLPTRWDDWYAATEAAFTELESQCERVIVAGLSLGGTLACWLAACHPTVAGLIVVNPRIEPPGENLFEILRNTLAAGIEVAPAIANDVADPSVREQGYDAIPLAGALSLAEAQVALEELLPEIRCPALIMTSRQDHVVLPSSGDFLAERVSGPVERLWLERSYHVATIDFDKDEINARSVAFARKIFGT